MSKELEDFIKEELGLPVHRLASGDYQSFGAAMAEKTYKRFVPIRYAAALMEIGGLVGARPVGATVDEIVGLVSKQLAYPATTDLEEIPHHYSDLVEFARKMQYDCKVANSVVNAQQAEIEGLKMQAINDSEANTAIRAERDAYKAKCEALANPFGSAPQ